MPSKKDKKDKEEADLKATAEAEEIKLTPEKLKEIVPDLDKVVGEE